MIYFLLMKMFTFGDKYKLEDMYWKRKVYKFVNGYDF